MSREFLAIKGGTTLRNSVMKDDTARPSHAAQRAVLAVRCARNARERRIDKILWFVAVSATIVLTVLALPRYFPQGRYQLAAVSPHTAVVAIRFAEQTTPADIARFLETYELSRIEEPPINGFHRFRWSGRTLSADELTDRVGRIRQDRVVDLIAVN